MFKLLQRYRMRRYQKEWQRGYAWAAVTLVAGRMTTSQLENQTGAALSEKGDHPFELGARAALNSFVRLPEQAIVYAAQKGHITLNGRVLRK